MPILLLHYKVNIQVTKTQYDPTLKKKCPCVCMCVEKSLEGNHKYK